VKEFDARLRLEKMDGAALVHGAAYGTLVAATEELLGRNLARALVVAGTYHGKRSTEDGGNLVDLLADFDATRVAVRAEGGLSEGEA
jgi:hypothetical protein